jgi:hypothetical protein
MRQRQPRNPQSTNAAKVTQGYLGYLRYFASGPHPVFGLHVGIGPPSGAGSIGAAIATYVLTRPSNKTASLIAFFMAFLLVAQAHADAQELARP